MTKVFFCCFLCVLWSATASASPRIITIRTKELLPEGRWDLISKMHGGHEFPKGNTNHECEFRNGSWLEWRSADFLRTREIVTLYSRKYTDIQEIDCESPKSREISKGIVRIIGDTLEICVAARGKARPTEFDSSQGVLWRMRRLSGK